MRRGEVTLSGVVDSDYERSLIDQAVTRLAGVQQLSNEIELRRAESERNVAKLGVSALGKSLWKAVAIAACCVAVAAQPVADVSGCQRPPPETAVPGWSPWRGTELVSRRRSVCAPR